MASAAGSAMKIMKNPAVQKGAAAVGGTLLGKKIAGPSGEQKAGMTAAGQGAQALGNYSQPLMAQGMGFAQRGGENMDSAARYYQGVMGNRAQAREHLAPEINTIMDFYRGSDAKISRTMRGGARDYALAENARQRVGQTAGLIPAARRNAAEMLGGLGGSQLQGGAAYTGQGINSSVGAANAGTQLYNMSRDQRNEQGEVGKTMGNFIYDILGTQFPQGKAPAPAGPYSGPAPIQSQGASKPVPQLPAGQSNVPGVKAPSVGTGMQGQFMPPGPGAPRNPYVMYQNAGR